MAKRKRRRAPLITECWWCSDPFTVPGEARPTRAVFRNLTTGALVRICSTCGPSFDKAARSPDDAGNGRPPGA